jgi:Zn-dependent protease with chaperone function
MKKLVLSMLLGVGVFALIAWTVQWREDRADRIAASKAEYESTVADNARNMRAQILAAEIENVRLEFGNAVAAEYRLCRTWAPTVKANQIKCAKLMDRVKRANAARPKW